MSDSPDDKMAGYKRPPKRSQWRKGESGNVNRRHTSRARNAVEWTSQLLLKPVEIALNGEVIKVPTLEAIATVVSIKALTGDQRALALQLKLREYAARNTTMKVEMVFVDSDYTRALAAEAVSGETDDG